MYSTGSAWIDTVVRWFGANWPQQYLPSVALVGLLFALFNYIRSSQRERFKLGIDLILKLGARFDSEQMLEHRAKAARAFLDRPDIEILKRAARTESRQLLKECTEREGAPLYGPDPENQSVAAVLDFFEEVGFLLRRRAIDVEAVHTFFQWWLEAYCRATSKWRAEDGQPGLEWEDFELLCRTIETFDECASRWRWLWLRSLEWELRGKPYLWFQSWGKRRPTKRWATLDEDALRALEGDCELISRNESSWVARQRVRRLRK